MRNYTKEEVRAAEGFMLLIGIMDNYHLKAAYGAGMIAMWGKMKAEWEEISKDANFHMVESMTLCSHPDEEVDDAIEFMIMIEKENDDSMKSAFAAGTISMWDTIKKAKAKLEAIKINPLLGVPISRN